MIENIMLTTIDNPYDPFTQFDEWLSFDAEKGYYTMEYLARIANTSEELSDDDNELEIQRAMKEIVEIHAHGLYVLAREVVSGGRES